MKNCAGIMAFACLFLFLMPASQYAAVNVKVGIYQNEPLIFTDDTGKAKGIFVDVLEYVASKEKWAIQYVVGSFQQGLERLQSGDIDILCTIAYSKERDRLFDFTKENLLTNWGQIYTNKTSDIRTIVDLDNKKVSVLQGDIHYSALKKIMTEFRIKCQFIETRSYSSAMDLIAEGKADAVVINRFAGMKYAVNSQFNPSAIIFNPIRIHYAVPEGKNQKIQSTIDTHLASLKSDEGSIYYRSLDKWFGVTSGRLTIPVWAKWSLVTVVGLILISFLGNIVLRIKVREKTNVIRKELAEREKTEKSLAERISLLELSAEVSKALIKEAKLRDALQQCTDALVKYLDASFARIWLLNPADKILELNASSGLYTNIDGTYSRVPLGESKIGRIAVEGQIVLSNKVIGDADFVDQEWAKREQMTAFAGCPLIVEKDVVGVIAVFSQNPFSEAVMKALSSVSDQIVLGIEHLQAEENLREREEQYRDLFENANELIQSVSNDGRFLRVNKKWKDTLGYSEEDIANILIWDIIHPEAAQHCQEVFSKIFCGERVDVIETTFVAKDGTSIPVEGTASCKCVDGKPVSTRSIFRDIREKKRIEEERNKLKSRFRKVQKLEAIGTLAGGVAHDFNNLLMTIQGNASLMLMDFESYHPHYKPLKDIENAVKSGAKLTRQLLGYARKGKYNVRPINFNEIVEETSETFGRTRKEIAIHLQLERELHSIEADQGQLEQVLLNLYVNSADAMSDGGDLTLRTFNVSHNDLKGKLYDPKPGTYVKLTVNDTGIGIDKKTQERIFDPFFTTKEMGRGTGLGLASVYGIIKGHGGYIDVESEPAIGTTFSIYLPASDKAIEQKVEASDQIMRGSGIVLIIDDEEMVLHANAQMLKKLGYTVVEATSGSQAIEKFKENREQFDLIILDMIMPETSGSEVFDIMKEIKPDVKMLLSSGYSIEGQASEILNRGCNGFIQKPFSLKRLSEKINEILNE